MRTRWGRQVEDLQTWVDIACAGLVEEAQRGIALEVNHHFDEAYDGAIDEGADPVDANEQALQSLGDPYQARKGFRHVHLTNDEIRRLFPSPFFTRIGTMLVALSWVMTCYAGEGLVASTILTGMAGRAWLRGQQPRRRIFAYYTLTLAMTLLVAYLQEECANLFVLGWLLAFAAMLEHDLQIQQKLLRITAKR